MSTNTTILLAALILGGAIVAATAIASKGGEPGATSIADAPPPATTTTSDVETGPGLRTVTTDERVARLERDLETALAEIRRLHGDGASDEAPSAEAGRSAAEVAKARERFFALSAAYALGAASKEQVAELFELTKDKALMERVVAGLASRIEENPEDLDARMQLAEVQAARIHSAESITERSLIGKDIGAQLGAILERDPEHWDANFMRAVGISHSQRTPQGRARAIEAFESLISLQQSRAVEPRFAETYGQLAQVHLAERDVAKARAAIEAGLARHPDDADLQKMLAGLDE